MENNQNVSGRSRGCWAALGAVGMQITAEEHPTDTQLVSLSYTEIIVLGIALDESRPVVSSFFKDEEQAVLNIKLRFAAHSINGSTMLRGE